MKQFEEKRSKGNPMMQPVVEEVSDIGSNLGNEEEEDFIRGPLTPEVGNPKEIDERRTWDTVGQNRADNINNKDTVDDQLWQGRNENNVEKPQTSKILGENWDKNENVESSQTFDGEPRNDENHDV